MNLDLCVRRRRGAAFVAVALACMLLVPARAAAQNCPGQGSLPRAAQRDAAPFALGCAQAPGWPSWHLWTPPHREPAPRPGFAPGDAVALPRWLVTWRCTGWLLLPVVPQSLATMGYVLDRPEWPCGTTP
ncbi:MAG: hypothetical protein ACK595_13135 [Planctomycetota bacterium]|jgi:hypothetical protein